MALFVTSFSRDLYEATGKNLLASFLRIRHPGRFFVGYEGKRPEVMSPSLDCVDISQDSFLNAWLEANKDIIPVSYGGTCPECTCPNREVRHAKHVHGCPGSWMNRTASRFFRKVVTLRLAVEHAAKIKTNLLVWVDSDSRFLKIVPDTYLVNCLGRTGCFYFRGHRPAIESGIMGFDLRAGGKALIEEICQLYTSGEFRKHERWDDGYIWTKLVEERSDLKSVDLVRTASRTLSPMERRRQGATKAAKNNNVIPTTTMASYITHYKGSHGRVLGIMQ